MAEKVAQVKKVMKKEQHQVKQLLINFAATLDPGMDFFHHLCNPVGDAMTIAASEFLHFTGMDPLLTTEVFKGQTRNALSINLDFRIGGDLYNQYDDISLESIIMSEGDIEITDSKHKTKRQRLGFLKGNLDSTLFKKSKGFLKNFEKTIEYGANKELVSLKKLKQRSGQLVQQSSFKGIRGEELGHAFKAKEVKNFNILASTDPDSLPLRLKNAFSKEANLQLELEERFSVGRSYSGFLPDGTFDDEFKGKVDLDMASYIQSSDKKSFHYFEVIDGKTGKKVTTTSFGPQLGLQIERSLTVANRLDKYSMIACKDTQLSFLSATSKDSTLKLLWRDSKNTQSPYPDLATLKAKGIDNRGLITQLSNGHFVWMTSEKTGDDTYTFEFKIFDKNFEIIEDFEDHDNFELEIQRLDETYDELDAYSAYGLRSQLASEGIPLLYRKGQTDENPLGYQETLEKYQEIWRKNGWYDFQTEEIAYLKDLLIKMKHAKQLDVSLSAMYKLETWIPTKYELATILELSCTETVYDSLKSKYHLSSQESLIKMGIDNLEIEVFNVLNNNDALRRLCNNLFEFGRSASIGLSNLLVPQKLESEAFDWQTGDLNPLYIRGDVFRGLNTIFWKLQNIQESWSANVGGSGTLTVKNSILELCKIPQSMFALTTRDVRLLQFRWLLEKMEFRSISV